MPEPERAPDDRTLAQPESARDASRDLSIPKDVEQHASAPKLAGYVLTRPLGRGAFAEVWKAWQARTRKWVAVKVFTQRKGINWVFLQREVERLIRLDRHPSVVSLLDADLTGDPAFYVMDLFEHGSLARYVEGERPATLTQAARWFEEACRALVFVHAKGIIHCDLKPANLLADEEGRMRLADFGQSRIVTESSGALGTLYYMAPEQAATESEASALQPDVRWDIYALGTTFHAIASGKTPRGASRSRLEAAGTLSERLRVYREIVATEPLPPISGDRELSAIIAKCTAPHPADRYASVAEIVADLEARREGRPVSLLAHDRLYRAERFVQRHGAWVAVAAGLLVALVGSAVQIFSQNRALSRQLAASYASRARMAAEAGDPATAAALYAEANAVKPDAGLRRSALSYLAGLERPKRVWEVGSSRVDLQACKLEYSIVSPK